MGIVWRCWYITKPSQAGRILRDALSILERQWQPKGETQHISKTKQERESRSNSSFVSSEKTFYHGPPYKYIPVPTYPNLFLSGIDTPSKPFPSALYSYWKGGVRGAFLCGHRAPRTNGLRLFAFNIRSLFQSNSYHKQVFSSASFVSEEAQEIPRNIISQDWQVGVFDRFWRFNQTLNRA